MGQIKAAAMNFKTPFYVIHKNELDDNYKKLTSALEKHWNNYIIGYSYKTNALPWIIKHFDSLGCYAETVSEDEYELAKLVGVTKNKIIYNGPIKTKESFLGIRRYIKINLFEILWFFFFLAILFSMIINDSVYITTILRWSVLLLLMFFLKGKEKDYSIAAKILIANGIIQSVGVFLELFFYNKWWPLVNTILAKSGIDVCWRICFKR